MEESAPPGAGASRPARAETNARRPSIGLFELTWHPQNLRELCRIVDAEASDVTVFTSEDHYDDWLADADLDHAHGAYEWVVRSEDESLGSYFERVERICSETLDVLMVLTPFGSGVVTSHFVEFDPDCASVCWLYNSRAVVRSTREATGARADLREVTPRLRRALLPEDPETAERSLKPHRYYLRPYVLERYDAYVVEYPPIREFLAERWEWDRGGPVYEFSPYVYEGDDDASVGERDSRPIEVTVSGRVVENARDYDQVLDAFEDVFETHGDDAALTILGRPVGDYGDRIVERCRDLASRGYPVSAYDDWVPPDEFDRVLGRSDALLNPIYLVEETTREPAPDEYRSRTKGTGVLFDALRRGTPLLLPEGFVVAPMIEGSTLTYDGEADLRRTLERLLDEPETLASLRERARENAAAFALETQRRRFHDLVDDVLSNAGR